MCGIFGVIAGSKAPYSDEFLKRSLNILAEVSESRGKDSSGLCLNRSGGEGIKVFKGPVRVRRLLKNPEVQRAVDGTFSNRSAGAWAFGHARLVTNGSQLRGFNNQPVVKDGILGVHNGIVVNADELWEAHHDLEREYEIDTEIVLALVRKYLGGGDALGKAVSRAIDDVFGTASVALGFIDLQAFVLATNNGSLYTLHNDRDILFFASEWHTLRVLQGKMDLAPLGEFTVAPVDPGCGLVVNTDRFRVQPFEIEGDSHPGASSWANPALIDVRDIHPEEDQLSAVIDLNRIHLHIGAAAERALLDYPVEHIEKLKRCTCCVLPETFPFISFDEHGVCNYCRNYKVPFKDRPIDELHRLVEPYRRTNGQAEVLIPLSGGRDSTYVLHTAVKELGLKAVAYTYDWGMVTDLARRNVARICGELGVENIIVAADIHWKRRNIRNNIKAWLRYPSLGMIPLFMAGDKFFFWHAWRIKKQLDVKLEIWGINPLENTDFKTGFAGLPPSHDKKRIYSLSTLNQAKLFGFVAANLLRSPGYLNQSILDSLGSFGSRYFMPKSDYYHLFDYMPWNEQRIEETILGQYDWETSVDTRSTWRIGDGTASFYNYIYTRVAGFSEHDTFRSNQVRCGMLTREEALDLIMEENAPRYNSLKWYLEIVGLDFEDTLRRVNTIPSRF